MQSSGCFCSGSPRCCRGRATAELGWRCQDQDMDCCATIPEPGTQRGQGRIRRTSQHQSHLQPKLSSGSLQCCCQPVADQRLAGCSSAASSFHIVSVSARTAVLGTQWRAGHAVVRAEKEHTMEGTQTLVAGHWVASTLHTHLSHIAGCARSALAAICGCWRIVHSRVMVDRSRTRAHGRRSRSTVLAYSCPLTGKTSSSTRTRV